jgi:transcriptional regulator GlxA family with amidase domain
LIVLLLVPDLLNVFQPRELTEKPFVHAALVEWLLAHLDEPISLSDMEQRTSYSRRSLQLAFKQHFGCGPMQWLRRQRLAKARALLEQPGACHNLSQVAMACGYLSSASFSRDYLARYGERPSHAWRRFRFNEAN